MDTYFKERDEFRFKDGKSRIWNGTNTAHAKLAMGKNNYLSEGAAVQRTRLGDGIGLGKEMFVWPAM